MAMVNPKTVAMVVILDRMILSQPCQKTKLNLIPEGHPETLQYVGLEASQMPRHLVPGAKYVTKYLVKRSKC